MKKNRINFKMPAVIAASLAAAAAVTVTAGAIVNYFHQRSVDTFIYDASGSPATTVINETSPLTSANEHFRITLDKSYYDGANLTCILTVESLDGTEIPNLGVKGSHYEDFRAGGTYTLNCWQSTRYLWNDTDYTQKRAYVAHISDKWLRMLYTPDVGDEGLTGGTYLKFNDPNYAPPQKYVLTDGGTYAPAVPESEWNIFYGIELYTDVEKNVETIELFNENGDKLIMSQIGYYSDNTSTFPIQDDIITDPAEQGLAFVLNDGTTKAFDKFISDAMKLPEYCYVLFPEFIQLGDYAGIEINGVQYLR